MRCWAVVDGQWCRAPATGGYCDEHRPPQPTVDPTRTVTALMAAAHAAMHHQSTVALGPPCHVCGKPMYAGLAAVEDHATHPCCDPDYEDLLEERRRRRYAREQSRRRHRSAR